MRKISYILILAGVIVIFIPKLSEWVNDYKQDKLLESWETVMELQADEQVQQQYQELTDLFEENEIDAADKDLDAAEPTSTTTETQPIATTKETPKAIPQPIAVIEIDKIGVKLPILEGATEENMKYSAVHLTETSPLGEIGNAAVAAHRARSKGRLFNQLDELENGDTITIKSGTQEFIYTVFNVSLVEPTDVSVLNRNKKDKVLTLITCDPIENATHRLIVHAKMDNE